MVISRLALEAFQNQRLIRECLLMSIFKGAFTSLYILNMNINRMIDKKCIEYIVYEIETVFNTEYAICHNEALIVVDSGHCIQPSNIRKINGISKYVIVESNELRSHSTSLSTNKACLIIKIKSIEDCVLPVNKAYKDLPFYVSFQTKSDQGGKEILGTLWPQVDPSNRILYSKSAEIVLSEFESD